MGKGGVPQIPVDPDLDLHAPNAGDIVEGRSDQDHCEVDSRKEEDPIEIPCRNEVIQRIPLKQRHPDIDDCIFSSIHSVCLDTMAGWKYKGQAHSFLDDYDET